MLLLALRKHHHVVKQDQINQVESLDLVTFGCLVAVGGGWSWC